MLSEERKNDERKTRRKNEQPPSSSLYTHSVIVVLKYILTGSFFPDHRGLGHAVGLTVDDQLSVPLDVHVRRFDGPLRRHYITVGGEKVKGGGHRK